MVEPAGIEPNRRPLQCHCSALPAELWPRERRRRIEMLRGCVNSAGANKRGCRVQSTAGRRISVTVSSGLSGEPARAGARIGKHDIGLSGFSNACFRAGTCASARSTPAAPRCASSPSHRATRGTSADRPKTTTSRPPASAAEEFSARKSCRHDTPASMRSKVAPQPRQRRISPERDRPSAGSAVDSPTFFRPQQPSAAVVLVADSKPGEPRG